MQLTLSRYYLNGYLTGKNPIVSWISHKDIPRIIELFIANKELSGIFNVCSPNTVTSDEFARAFATVMNSRILYRVPSALLRLILASGLRFLNILSTCIPGGCRKLTISGLTMIF